MQNLPFKPKGNKVKERLYSLRELSCCIEDFTGRANPLSSVVWDLVKVKSSVADINVRLIITRMILMYSENVCKML